MTLLFTTFLLQFTAFLLQFTAVTIFYCSLLFFTASYHIFTASYHIGDQNFKKKNLPKITTIYCNLLQFYCNLQQQFTAFSCTANAFRVVSTSKYRLFSTSILLQFTALLDLLQFTAFTIFYCILLQVTAIYCELPRFTAQVGPQCKL